MLPFSNFRRSRARWASAVVLLLALVSRAAVAGAAPPPAADAPAATPEPRGPTDDFDRGTPRSTVRGYLEAVRSGDWERAAEYLDLRRLRPAERPQRGSELAAQLAAVLEQTLWVELGELSAEPEGEREDGLPRGEELVGKIETSKDTVDVVLARVPRADDGVPVWKFSAPTVRLVPALYEEFGYGRLGEVLPRFFFETRFLGVQLWQWVGIRSPPRSPPASRRPSCGGRRVRSTTTSSPPRSPPRGSAAPC
jgi:MscS family membrane protein